MPWFQTLCLILLNRVSNVCPPFCFNSPHHTPTKPTPPTPPLSLSFLIASPDLDKRVLGFFFNCILYIIQYSG